MTTDKTRRDFLLRYARICAFGSFGFYLSCGAKKSKEVSSEVLPEVTQCDDLSQVSEVELVKRKSLGYVEVTPMEDKNCLNCNLFIPAKDDEKCGGCLLFAGPVFEEAYCTYWAEVEEG